jgi:steroid delta-isomerase-like uncharacterized protein
VKRGVSAGVDAEAYSPCLGALMAKSAKKAAPKPAKKIKAGTKKPSPASKAVPKRRVTPTLRPAPAPARKPAQSRSAPASPHLAAVRALLEAERQHDLNAVMAGFGPEPTLEFAGGPRHSGTERVSQIYADLLRAFPDLQIEITAEHESPQSVVVEYVMQGTHRQQWLGMAPRGRSLSLPVCAVFHFDKRGQLASQRIYLDRNLAIVQLTSGLLR